ncbi:MAG: VOC family protein [Acidimicrobiales bacterium]|nr:VOC family protein [Acidimicrobiales bacterium]
MSESLELGCFSVSLQVQDLDASIAFYEKLGFTALGGDDSYRMLANGTTVIGLFAGHIEETILTFNPGLGQDFAQTSIDQGGDAMPEPVADFTDVRVIEKRLEDAGVALEARTESAEGPAHILVRDPDGNLLMFDQFF